MMNIVQHHDDSLPHISPVPQPHSTMRYEKPSVPDLSVCDTSFVIESPKKINKKIYATDDVEEPRQTVPRKINMKEPRATKASLARMALNQPVKNQNQTVKKKASPLYKPCQGNQKVNKKSENTSEVEISRKRNFQSYCPDDYSDLNIEDNESFLIEPSPQKNSGDLSYEKAILEDILKGNPDFKSNKEMKAFIGSSLNKTSEQHKKKVDHRKPIKIDSSKHPVPSEHNIRNLQSDTPISQENKKFNWSLIDLENGSLLLDDTDCFDSFNENDVHLNFQQENLQVEKNPQTLNKSELHEDNIPAKTPNSFEIQSADDINNDKLIGSACNYLPNNSVNNITRNESTAKDMDSKFVEMNPAQEKSLPLNDREDIDKNLTALSCNKSTDGKGNEKLMELMLSQQEQLKLLQQQVHDFLSYQKDIVVQDENSKLKNDSAANIEIVEVQNRQQLQIEKLQEQLQQFLDNTPKKTPVREISTQSSFIDDRKMSIGVNTSLQWPATTTVDQETNTSQCITDQGRFPSDRGISSRVNNSDDSLDRHSESYTSNKCAPISCQQKTPYRKRNSKVSSSTVSSSSFSAHSSSLDSGSFFSQETQNGSKMSAQDHISPVKDVNISPFVDNSHLQSPEKNSESYAAEQWKSPVLGESASVLMEQKSQRTTQAPATDNAEFCARIMEQVKSFIEAQDIEVVENEEVNINHAENEILCDDDKDNDDHNVEKQVHLPESFQMKTTEENLSNRPMLKEDVKEIMTMKPIQNTKILQNLLPQINYVTMSSLNDTFQDFSIPDVDEIALKYLPNNFTDNLRQEGRQFHEITNKSVKFHGVYQFQHKNKQTTMTSVNFSCNMSLASQKYLQKYQLSNLQNENQQNDKTDGKKKIEMKNNDNENKINKENILDFKKLRNLPKLK